MASCEFGGAARASSVGRVRDGFAVVRAARLRQGVDLEAAGSAPSCLACCSAWTTSGYVPPSRRSRGSLRPPWSRRRVAAARRRRKRLTVILSPLRPLTRIFLPASSTSGKLKLLLLAEQHDLRAEAAA